MKNKKRIRIFWGVVLGVVIVLRLFAKPAPDSAYYLNPRPDVLVIAHQGGDGIFPGDTLYAYEHAAALGADVFEMDAHITKDGEIVLIKLVKPAADKVTILLGYIRLDLVGKGGFSTACIAFDDEYFARAILYAIKS